MHSPKRIPPWRCLNKIWEISLFSAEHLNNAMLWVQHKWFLVQWVCVMKKNPYISYPEILNLIRRMKMLSPTEEKTTPPKKQPKQTKLTLHVCKNRHVFQLLYWDKPKR